ncbi:sensor histidine kinase [Flavobacterium selenitireducens]|uniref:sensor histidine kinase n=1 Tax=Flavobacterium selenitireducens TaxID=2722704 RepID=UPI00168B7DCA|nr:histidine kinase [Flavobacterium selenitireducens]MBD3581329.1 histidine kinase [Flavobacterium selenitireducens]
MDACFAKSCSQNRFIDFLIEGRFRFWRHFIVWCYMLGTFVISRFGEDSGQPLAIAKSVIWNAYFLSMFYLNMYVLIPRLLYKEKYLTYLFSLFVVIIGGYLSLAFLSDLYLDGYSFTRSGRTSELRGAMHQYFIAIHMIVLMVFASTSIKLFQRWARDTKRISELETHSLQMELRELRNQVNPHFLFNMLNNVNVLIRKNPDQAIATVHKLSDFLRYQLYENNAQAVLLKPEIHFLQDLLALEKMRRDDFTFSLDVDNTIPDLEKADNLMLPPNLFISFVENAIKHSADSEHPSSIDVHFTISDTHLFFKCKNTKPLEKRQENQGGLGLTNAKRRLELLYGETYDLRISESKTQYELTLTIPI